VSIVNVTKASGFRGARDAKWWTKDSKYGVKYQCASCGKITLGSGNDSGMHWPTCVRRKTAVVGTARAEIAQIVPSSPPSAGVTVEAPAWDPKQVSRLLANVPNPRSWEAEPESFKTIPGSANYIEGLNEGLTHTRPLVAQLQIALTTIDTLTQKKTDGSAGVSGMLGAPSKPKVVKTLLKPRASPKVDGE
jgi:hypothetical protein